MTTMELDACKMQLIRDILAIDSSETLDKVRKCVKGVLKMQQKDVSSKLFQKIPNTIEELGESIERGMEDMRAGRMTESEEVFRKLEEKYL